MAIRKIQVADTDGNIYYFETDATIVDLTSLKLSSTNVKDALEEIDNKKVSKKCTWNDLKGGVVLNGLWNN